MIERVKRNSKKLAQEYAKKIASFFAKRYDVLLVPHFKVQDFVRRVGRRLRRSTVREILGLGFGRLKSALADACERYGCVLHWVCEVRLQN